MALVTGSSRGLGFLLAREFAHHGCRVALCARDQRELDRAREELERHAGRIVNITSIGSKVSMPHLLPYNSAKFAALGLSEGLRAELAREGISVVTIVPGLMRTGSHLNALFKGRQEREYGWFALAASLPLVSMDAELAARRIVEAARWGETERILSLPANLAARFHGLFPGTAVNIFELVNRLILPRPVADGAATVKGMEAQERLASPLFEFLTAWGLSAARRYHQHPSAPAADDA